MPVGVVKTKRDERLWSRAKAAARKKFTEGTERFYKYAMGAYQQMKGEKAMKPILIKAQVRQHKRQAASGKITTVREHQTRRVKKPVSDLSKLSRKQQQAMIDKLARLPLKELRRRQGIVVSQQKSTYAQWKKASGPEKKRLEAGASNLNVRERMLTAAVDKRALGKGIVKQHQRRTKGGKVSTVREHQTTRKQKAGGGWKVTSRRGGVATVWKQGNVTITKETRRYVVRGIGDTARGALTLQGAQDFVREQQAFALGRKQAGGKLTEHESPHLKDTTDYYRERRDYHRAHAKYHEGEQGKHKEASKKWLHHAGAAQAHSAKAGIHGDDYYWSRRAAVASVLSNDEASTDQELTTHFKTEFKMSDAEAKHYVSQRGRFLKDPAKNASDLKPYKPKRTEKAMNLQQYPALEKAVNRVTLSKSLEFTKTGREIKDAVVGKITACRTELAVLVIEWKAGLRVRSNDCDEAEEPTTGVEPPQEPYRVKNKRREIDDLGRIVRNLAEGKTYKLSEYELKELGF